MAELASFNHINFGYIGTIHYIDIAKIATWNTIQVIDTSVTLSLLSGLGIYWKLDELSGTLYDSLGTYDLGTYHDPSLNATGKIHTGVSFDVSSCNAVNYDFSAYMNEYVTDQLTVSMWVKFNKLASTAPAKTQQLFGIYYDTDPYWPVNIYLSQSNDKLYAGFYDVDSSYFGFGNLSTTISTNVWYHIVVTANGIGKYPIMYVNDVSVQGSTIQLRNIFTNPYLVILGNSGFGTNEAAKAIIDEVGIWNRALTSSEITSLYNSGNGLTYPFTGLLSGLQGYWKLDESTGTTLYDSIGVNHLTNFGASVGYADAISMRSVNFDTSSDYLQDTTISGLDASNNEFSVSFWAKFDTLPKDTGIRAGLVSVSGTTGIHMAGNGESYNYLGAYVFSVDGSVQSTETTAATFTPVINTWYHIAFIYRGIGYLASLYVNAKNAKGWSNNKILTTNTRAPENYITVGNAYNASPKYGMDGKIDEIGYWNRALTLYEVSTLYNNGMGLSHPFTESPQSILLNDLQAYWKLDEVDGSLYDSLGTNDASIIGATQDASGKISRAVYFDAANEMVYCGLGDNLRITEALTLTAWVKLETSQATYARIVNKEGNYTFYINSGTGCLRWFHTGTDIELNQISSFDLRDNTWHFITATFDKAYIRGYVDASLKGIYAYTSSLPDLPAVPMIIGNRLAGDRYTKGIIDEVGIWSRALRDEEITSLYNGGNGLTYPFSEPSSSLLSGLRAYWKLDETTGTTIYDSVGTTNLTTNRNPSLGREGVVGYCIQYDISTSNTYVNYPGYPAIDTSGWTEYSISFWSYFTNDPSSVNREAYLMRYTPGDVTFYHLVRGVGTDANHKNQMLFYIKDASDNGSYSYSAATGVPSIIPDTWQHYVFSFKMGEQPTIWTNDVSYRSGSTFTKPLGGPMGSFSIGNNYVGYPNAMTSHKLDEVGIWNRKLTEEEVATLYNGGNGISYPF